ncbi:hypothetical protein TSAR_009084 [Trichomalopsis sarcophagae]|uniref:Odorant receptor n=1 Tax=Trichomalopsis sarcophagae TaxID=543379 RepID=A0A232EZE2_9HYME|nr:hypothetical protein TSAR_009084 [Trichomalopsis sarcophagae]
MSVRKDMHVFESQYYRIYKNSVKIIGLWPYENIQIKRVIRISIILLLISLVILQAIRLYEELGRDLDIVLELIASLSYFAGCLSKYITTIRAQSAFRFLYDQIAGHWQIITDIKEREILEESTSQSQTLCLSYMVAAYSALVVYSTMPAIAPAVLDIVIPLNESRKKTFPYYAEYFIDDEAYYYQLMGHGTIVFTVSVMVYVSIDTMYACCAQHLCGLFSIVEYRLQEALRTDDKLHLEPPERDKLTHKKLHEAIILHKNSIEFAFLIENTYALCFLLVMGLNLTVIVFTAVVIIINLGDMKQMIRLTLLFGAFSFHLFFNCVPGQKVHDKSISIMNSAYFSEWYNVSLKSRKLIQFVMHRSLNPCQFTAGGLFVMNMENFGSIMKSSMSYVTVIASIR